VKITCPICGKVLEDAPDDWGPRPFCSTRCKMVDLGNWLNEVYRVSQPLRQEDAERDEDELS
jgi:uncharacterized protein